MPAAEFACPRCQTSFAVEPGTREAATTCPGCRSELQAHFFPAFFRPSETVAAGAPLLDTAEAGCFYHPQKQAAHVCDGCGRFICPLCSIDLGTEHLCPACLSAGRKKGRLASLENTRTRYDNIALGLAVAALFTSFFSMVVAPAAIFVALRYWKQPGGIVSSGKARRVAALVIALGALALWGSILGLAIYGATLGNHHRP